jgi:hypothetical protein
MYDLDTIVRLNAAKQPKPVGRVHYGVWLVLAAHLRGVLDANQSLALDNDNDRARLLRALLCALLEAL